MNTLACDGQSKIKRADEELAKLFKEAKFSGSVLVAKDGKVIYQNNTGYADAEHSVPINFNTKFELASVSKIFTAILVLQLVEKGKINLDARVADYIPEFNRPDGREIRIHHLLSHTSGIQDFVGLNCDFASWTRKEFMEALNKTPINFPAGTKFEYASSTYVLLRFIIEQVTGKSYGENLKTNILNVAGMHNSGLINNNEIIHGRANGYLSREGVFINAMPVANHDIFFGAASIYSTTHDLLKLDQELYKNTLLSSNSKEKMFTVVQPPYGYGWFIDDDPKNGKTLSHGGDVFGFTTLIERKLKSKTALIMLGNMQDIDREKIVKILNQVTP